MENRPSRSWVTNPIAPERPRWSCWARALGRNDNSSAALITRSRVSAFTCVRPFNAFDAVAIDTPAVFATSARVGRLALISPFLIIVPALSLPVLPLDLPPFTRSEPKYASYWGPGLPRCNTECTLCPHHCAPHFAYSGHINRPNLQILYANLTQLVYCLRPLLIALDQLGALQHQRGQLDQLIRRNKRAVPFPKPHTRGSRQYAHLDMTSAAQVAD